MKINSLTTSEEQLMRVIWELEQAFMRNIMEAYPEPKPHQNTVSTFLKILVEKDFLSIEKQGRIFRYIPKINFEEYRKHCLLDLVSNFYGDDKNTLIKDLSLESALIIEEKNNEVPKLSPPKKPSTKRADSVIEDWKKELAKKDKKKDKEKSKKKKKAK